MTPELFEDICNDIENMSVGIIHICKSKGVSKRTFYEYMKSNKENQNRYARAKEVQIDFIAEEIIDISDDGSNDFMKIVKGDEEYELENKEVTNRSRLRVDSRKWILSKLDPKKYGDKIDIEHSGAIDFSSIISEARKRAQEKIDNE
jgi:hypothetical protein